MNIELTNIEDAIKGLLPTPIIIIVTFISLAVLTYVITKHAYKPIMKNLENRQQYVQKEIDNAEINNKESAVNLEKSIESLREAEFESKKIMDYASEESNKKSLAIIMKAKNKSDNLIEDAYREIENEMKKIKEQIRDEIVEVAFEASKKIIEKEIDEKTNKKIIDNFIDSI